MQQQKTKNIFIGSFKSNKQTDNKITEIKRKIKTLEVLKIFLMLSSSLIAMLYARYCESYIFFGVFFTLFFLILVNFCEEKQS